jgi:hypothetical protein
MATVGDVIDVLQNISYTTILPYFDIILPQHMDLSHIVSNYTYCNNIKRVFRIGEQHIIDAGIERDKRIGYMYRTQDIAHVCNKVHISIATMIQGGNGADFYRLYDERDPCPLFGAAQRIRILVFAFALKQELAGAERSQALNEVVLKTNVISITSIGHKLRNLAIAYWYSCASRKYYDEFSLLEIKSYVANVALYYMITTFELSDADLKLLCDAKQYTHVSTFRDMSPVCAIETSIDDLTQELASLKAKVKKLFNKVAALVTYHERRPNVTIKEAKIALGQAVFELRYALQLLCIKEVNNHFGL